MEKLTAAKIKSMAKEQVMAELTGKLQELGAEYVGAVPYIPVTVGEQEVWVELKPTTKQWTATKISPAFDPFEKQEEYRLEQEAKAKEAEIKKKEKEAKKKGGK